VRGVIAPATRLGFWVLLVEDDAWRPGATVARGCLRDLFARWPEGARAYAGQPVLFRPASSCGLALLAADFLPRPDFPLGAPTLPSSTVLEGPFDANGLAFDRLTYLVELSGPAAARTLEKEWKARRLAFQTRRKDGVRWSVVGKTFRARSGYLALREAAAAPPQVLCTARAWASGRFPASRVLAVFKPAPETCPACGSARVRLLKAVGVVDFPACVACLLRSGR